jgi:uncharacterized protein (DUF2267 family)
MAPVATGTEAIDKTVQLTHEWIKEIEEELQTSDRHFAFQSLRAVLHVLRDRLPLQEAAQLGSQLPILIRGIYYENFNPRDLPVKDRKPEEFLGRILDQLPAFDVIDPERIARAVFHVLGKRVSPGEIKDVRANFPKSMASLWD